MVSRDYAIALADEAQLQGKPLYYVANDVVRLYLRAKEKGYELEEAMEAYEAMDLFRKTGFTFVSEAFLTCLINDATSHNYETYADMCRKTGKSMGMFARLIFESPKEAVGKFSRLFSDIHFHFGMEGGKEFLCIACPRRSAVYASLLARLIDGLFDAYGYSSQHTEVIDGLAKIEYSKNLVSI